MDSVASSASRKRPAKEGECEHAWQTDEICVRCVGQVSTWYYVCQGTQRRLHLRDLAGVLGDEVIVHGQPFRRQGEGVAQVGQGRRPFGLGMCICRCRHDGQIESSH